MSVGPLIASAQRADRARLAERRGPLIASVSSLGARAAGRAPFRLPRGEGGGTIALSGVAKFASGAGQSYFLAMFVDHLVSGTGVSRSGFATLYALATVASAAITLMVGQIVDRNGVRRVWLAVAGGLAVACLGMSVATGPLLVLASLCLMRGFGQGSFPLLGTILVARRFAARRGRALSISAQGLTASGVLMPLLGAGLISAFGWRTALQLVAAGLAVFILPLGLLAGGRRRATSSPGAARGGLRETLRGPGVPGLLGIFAVPPLVSTALVVYAVSVLGRAGLSAGAAAGAISLSALAGAFGAVIGGQLSDRCRARALLAAMGATLAAAVLLLLSAQPILSMGGFVVLGLANGMSYTANGTVWANAYGTRRIGQIQGTANAGRIAGAAVGPLPLALLEQLTGSYIPGLLLLLTLSIGSALAGWRWRTPDERTVERSALRGLAAEA